MGNPLWNHYRCADGKWLSFTMPLPDLYWHNFCEVVGIPELENDPKFENLTVRAQHAIELIGILDQKFATKPRDEWTKIFSNYTFGYSPIYDRTDLADEPQLLANDYIVEMEHPAWGKIKTAGFPAQFSKTPASIRSAAPEFGQHTEEVLSEILGYTWEEINTLREKGALG